MPLSRPLDPDPLPDRAAPPLPAGQRRPQRADPRRLARLQGDRAHRRLRRARRRLTATPARAAPAAINVQGEVQKTLDVAEQRDLHAHERVERPSGRHGLGGDGRALPDPGSVPARQVPAACSTRSTARPTSTSTSRSAASSRSCARRRTWSTAAATSPRPTSCSPARTQVAAGYAIYGPTTMLVLTRGQRRRRLHARTPTSASSC